MPPDPTRPAFYDLSDRAKLRVRGADAARYLQGQLTNDVRRAATEVVYACLLTAKGRLVADVYVRADPAGGFLLDADPILRETLVARLERYIIADDVTVEDVTDDIALLHLPANGGLINFDLIAGAGLPVPTRADRFGGSGTDLFLPFGEVRAEFATLLADAGCVEATLADAETHRITVGVPRWGIELDENTLPPEAGLGARAISYDKGCYVGQETISRLKSIGHVNRHLRRLRAPDGDPLAAGLRLQDPTGRELGRVTSAAGSLALGYVRHGHEADGARLLAVDPTNETAAPREVEVVGLPYTPAA